MRLDGMAQTEMKGHQLTTKMIWVRLTLSGVPQISFWEFLCPFISVCAISSISDGLTHVGRSCSVFDSTIGLGGVMGLGDVMGSSHEPSLHDSDTCFSGALLSSFSVY